MQYIFTQKKVDQKKGNSLEILVYYERQRVNFKVVLKNPKQNTNKQLKFKTVSKPGQIQNSKCKTEFE